MNCCGNKRRAWMDETISSSRGSHTESNPQPAGTDKPDKIFVYTGNHGTTIRGVTSGKTYTFRYRGDMVTVDYRDSFAMMAERNLQVLPGSNK